MLDRTSIAIDQGIPLKERAYNGRAVYPWRRMEVGDSFLFPPHIKEASARALPRTVGKRIGRTFTTRRTPEGFRCWRVA